MDKRRRLLAKWGWISLAVTGVFTVVIMVASRRHEEAVPAAGADIEGLTRVLSRTVSADEVTIRFEDVTAQSGIDFHHMPTPRASLLPEDMGSGIACADFDGDGLIDLYFVNIAGNARPDAPMDETIGRSKLYRNIDGLRFEDVTDAAGVGFVGIGMGAAWGDYDNDGDLDLYVTAFGDNALYTNQGDGTFVDTTHLSGTQDKRFSTGCSWADFDRDGDLDLYVCNYVDFVFRQTDRGAIRRQYATEQPYTLNPSSYRPQPNSLFINNGDGTFRDVAVDVGVANADGRSLSAAWVDLNNDGWVDLYVANDVSNNGVYLNRCSDGVARFDDVGASTLAADYRGAMGIAVADIDDDLDQDLFITHWIAQENALYRNMLFDEKMGATTGGRLWFMDDADSIGLGQSSLDMVGWATAFADLDNDGRRDLWVLNGSTVENAADHSQLERQPALLFWNHPEKGMVDVAGVASDALGTPAVRRGGAQADFDRDGRIDLVLTRHGGSPQLLRNVSDAGHWVRVHLRQQGANTAALGARVVVVSGARTQTTQTTLLGASSSYLSQDELVAHFGLGPAESVSQITITWPDGTEEVHHDLPVDREYDFVHTPPDSPGH